MSQCGKQDNQDQDKQLGVAVSDGAWWMGEEGPSGHGGGDAPCCCCELPSFSSSLSHFVLELPVASRVGKSDQDEGGG